MSATRFTIVITCHNQGKFICGAVDSALAQGYAAKEIVVVDDASGDNSPEILRQYGDKIQFAALAINRGCPGSRNIGAAMGSGDYFVFLDGDDVLRPWALEVFSRVVELRKPKVILSSMEWFLDTVPALDPSKFPREIKFSEYEYLVKKNRQYQAGGSAIVIEAQVFRDVQGWTPEFSVVEDLDMLMKLSDAGLTVQILAPETTGYRIHSANARHRVPSMSAGVRKVLDREKAGTYPGGRQLRLDRYAILGAPVFYWIKCACKVRLYGIALAMLARGWPMFLAASARKIRTLVFGRTEPIRVPFDWPVKPSPEPAPQYAIQDSRRP
jgi:glycosyltransferase involved in cell wall biosynthesis